MGFGSLRGKIFDSCHQALINKEWINKEWINKEWINKEWINKGNEYIFIENKQL